ncbi:hypothetical protein V1505DRAFT_155954 [Lipomyces doorenjongii]
MVVRIGNYFYNFMRICAFCNVIGLILHSSMPAGGMNIKSLMKRAVTISLALLSLVPNLAGTRAKVACTSSTLWGCRTFFMAEVPVAWPHVISVICTGFLLQRWIDVSG